MIARGNLNKVTSFRDKSRIAEINQFALSKKQAKSIGMFGIGFVIYTVAFVISTMGVLLSAALCQGFETVGLVLIIAGSSGLIKFKFDNQYLEVVFTIYLLFSLSVILRAKSYDYNTLKTLFFNMNFSLFTYIIPLVVLFPRNLALYKKLFKVPVILGVIAIIYAIYFFNTLHNPNWLDRVSLGYAESLFFCLSLPIGFLLMNYIYFTKRKRWFAFIVMLISLYFLIYRARRGSMFMNITTLAGAGMIYLIYTKRTVLVIILSVFFVLVSSVFASNIKLPSMFDFLMSRKDEDTRSPVENDMKADMKPMDWAIGKGITGTYYSTSVIDDINDLSFQRNVIETGYLQIILKGGIVSITLLGLILIPGVYLGLFRSSNILSKAAGIFNLLWMIYTYPTIVSGFHIYYVLVWICVGICYSEKIRNLSNSTIGKYIYD